MSSVLARPCPKRWEELTGDDQRRSCADCGREVLAVAEMSLIEAKAASKAGACLSFVELPGGLVRTREGWRLWRTAVVAGALVACDDGPPPKPPAAPVAETPAATPVVAEEVPHASAPRRVLGAPILQNPAPTGPLGDGMDGLTEEPTLVPVKR